jgi:hypothetical protein
VGPHKTDGSSNKREDKTWKKKGNVNFIPYILTGCGVLEKPEVDGRESAE